MNMKCRTFQNIWWKTPTKQQYTELYWLTIEDCEAKAHGIILRFPCWETEQQFALAAVSNSTPESRWRLPEPSGEFPKHTHIKQNSLNHVFLGRKEMFLFNDALNTFIYGYVALDMVSLKTKRETERWRVKKKDERKREKKVKRQRERQRERESEREKKKKNSTNF